MLRDTVMNRALFSVLIPVFNHARFLRRAVESAVRDPLVGEVLVVDDGSADGSRAVIRDLVRAYGHRVRDIGDESVGNKGAHVRLNELVHAAKHEFVAVLNSDDMFVPSRFVVAYPFLRAGSTQFVSGHILIVDADGRVFGRKRGWLDPEYPFPAELRCDRVMEADWRQPAWQEAFLSRLLNQNFIATTSNMMFTKALHDRVGGFRDYRYCHDWDFAIRAALHGDIGWCNQYLTLYRIHGNNTINDVKQRIQADVRRMFRVITTDFRGVGSGFLGRAGLRENEYLRAA